MEANMKDKLEKVKKKRMRLKHGGYSFLVKGEVPEHRQYIKQYLTTIREGLIRDIGPEEKDLTTAQLILIDRLISLLGVIRLIEEKAKEDGIFRGKDLIASLKTSYIAYNNTVRLTLEKLGIHIRKADGVLTPFELAREVDKDKGK